MAVGTVNGLMQKIWLYSPDEGGSDAFVHITAVQRSGLQSLAEGAKVSYELVEGRNGKYVRRIKPS